jgi:hypothetical protein
MMMMMVVVSIVVVVTITVVVCAPVVAALVYDREIGTATIRDPHFTTVDPVRLTGNAVSLTALSHELDRCIRVYAATVSLTIVRRAGEYVALRHGHRAG